MLLTSNLMFLVYSTLSNSMLMNRLGTMTMMFTFMTYMNSMSMVSLTPGMTMFNNWFKLTTYNLPLTYLMFGMMMMLLLYNTTNVKYNLKSNFYMLLMMSNMMGLMLLPLVNDLLTLYMMMELQSYSLYLLTGLHNKSYNASRASLLYFMMGGMASVMILMGSYYMYNMTGTTNLTDMSLLNDMMNTNNNNNYMNLSMKDYFDMMVMALLFKMGLAPLHRWSMSVYNYAPTYMTAYMSMVAKMSMGCWLYVNSNLFNNYMFMMFFYVSLLMGSYKPLYQMNMKTMLAYSGMLNFGYVLLTMMTYDMSFYVYMMQYVLTHMMLFMGMLSASEYMEKPMTKWSPLLYMHQLRLPNLTLSFMLMLALFSLMGMPPLPGFYAKLYVLTGAMQDNYMLETCLMMVCSVLATYYYSNMMKMLMTSKNDNKMLEVNNINSTNAYMLSMCLMLLLTFFMYLPYLLEGLYIMMM
ncbi:NADH-ubiquinone oxidoreductase chain 2 (mitochondrion) [[Candida] jaroonii]|uniref:NADH-ubiquinone oxidoreductase chain 2 n=1 Tax=[Candida] jaroonii TaxID=467808 RepID=A0ACA9YFY9_9ASCO|nr:NADH-ubiquinone oxidoreductase chain 2 [[Candida] jaroonii]